MTGTTGMALVQDGELFYEMAGQGHPVVLLHGGFLDHQMWDEQVELLARRYRVIRFDARGHGRSSTPVGDFSHAEDLRDLLVHLAVPRATLVGHSLGGRTAIDAALAHPELVAALVLVGPGLSGWDFTDPVIAEYAREMQAAAQAQDGARVVEYFLRSWVDGPQRTPDQVDRQLRERLRRMALANLPKYAAARGAPRELGATQRLGEVRAPMLAMVGELDALDIQAIVDLLVRSVPGARRVVLPGAGHMLSLEQRDAFNRTVLEFLNGLEAG